MKPPNLLSRTRILVVAFLLAGLLAGAAAPSHAASVAAEADDGGWLDSYNRFAFRFNAAFYAGVERAVARLGRAPAEALEEGTRAEAPERRVDGGLGNVVSNLVNEPVTAIASLAVGDLPTAWHATQRFAVNSTAGFLGWYDRAAGYGLASTHSDIGLAMCRYGVGEGGYVVLPFVGPRTVRDGVADVVIVNALLWTSLVAVLGTGASIQAIVIAETLEIAADIVATRQIDPRAIALGGLDYEATRREYLEQRRARCRLAVAAEPGSAP